MIGQLSTKTIFIFANILLIMLHFCRSFYVILVELGCVIGQTFLERNFVFEKKNFCKLFDRFKEHWVIINKLMM